MLFPGVSWQCYQTLPLVLIKILLQKHDASILFNIRALIWQWRRPDRPDMTDNCWQLKLPLKIKGWITEKGSAFQLVPCTRAHILNIWMWAQEKKYVSLYRFVILHAVICFWVQAIPIMIYTLGRSKHYLSLQILEPTLRKSWYGWHNPGGLRDFLKYQWWSCGVGRNPWKRNRKTQAMELRAFCSGQRFSECLFHVNCGRCTVCGHAVCISTSGNSVLWMKNANKINK